MDSDVQNFLKALEEHPELREFFREDPDFARKVRVLLGQDYVGVGATELGLLAQLLREQMGNVSNLQSRQRFEAAIVSSVHDLQREYVSLISQIYERFQARSEHYRSWRSEGKNIITSIGKIQERFGQHSEHSAPSLMRRAEAIDRLLPAQQMSEKMIYQHFIKIPEEGFGLSDSPLVDETQSLPIDCEESLRMELEPIIQRAMNGMRHESSDPLQRILGYISLSQLSQVAKMLSGESAEKIFEEFDRIMKQEDIKDSFSPET